MTVKLSGNPQALYASAPFNHAKADIILRSSDKIDFRVFKLFLSLASPFFESLFDIPQPAEESKDQETKDGLAVVPVTENSVTLDILLRFCYPCTLAEDPEIEALGDALDILEAARKYSLDVVEKKARQAISIPKILEEAPLRCFAIAHRGRLREETLLAARCTLAQPLIPSWFQEIELLTASDLLGLLTYHKQCGEAVYTLRLDLSWITFHYESAEACSWLSGRYLSSSMVTTSAFGSPATFGGSSVFGSGGVSSQTTTNNCPCPRSNRSNTSAGGFKLALFNDSLRWWEDFMEETFMALRDKPCKETVQISAEKTVQAVKALNCPSCSPRITEGMRDFVDLFGRKIEEAVSKVTLHLDF